MGSLSIWHWLILGLVILLLFGKGRFSGMMGDVAKGLKEFKKGMAEDDAPPQPNGTPNGTNAPPRIDSTPSQTIENKPVDTNTQDPRP